jgi:hypothetical protein
LRRENIKLFIKKSIYVNYFSNNQYVKKTENETLFLEKKAIFAFDAKNASVFT